MHTVFRFRPIVFLAFIGLSLIISCTNDNEENLFDQEDCGEIENVSYQNDIKSVLSSNCYSCHASGVELNGINLENFTALKSLAESGRLLGAIDHQAGFSSMPPSGKKLNECDIESIKVWIQEGSQDN